MKIPKKISAIFMAVIMLLSMGLNGLVGTVEAASPETGDATGNGEIIIHKYKSEVVGGAGATAHDGSEITNSTLLPDDNDLLDNVTFKLTKVIMLDSQPADTTGYLTDGTNWYEVDSDFTPITEYTGSAGQKGIATFEDLPRGIYFVEELAAGTAGTQTNAPKTFDITSFFVSIPTTLLSGVQTDTVHVYPKNEGVIDKEPISTPVNNIVTWAIRANIPNDIANAQNFAIWDQLDLTKLELRRDGSYTPPYGVQIAVDGDGDGKIDLTTPGSLDVDVTEFFTVTYDVSGKLIATLKSDTDPNYKGFAELDKHKYNNLIVTFDTIILEETLGDIVNNAGADYTNKSGTDFEPTVPPVKTPAFGINIDKYKDGDPAQKLDNAEFYLFGTQALAEAAIANNDYSAALNKDDATNPTNPWVGTTGITSKTSTPGLIEFHGLNPGIYYLVESYTPNPYNLLAKPVKVEIRKNPSIDGEYQYRINDATDAGGTAEWEDMNTDPADLTTYIAEVPVNNVSGPELPLTGGAGTMLFTLFGLLLIGAAIVIYTISKKRKEKHA